MVLAAQHTLRAHKGPVNVCVYNKTQDSQFVLSGGQDRTIRLWNASKGTHIKSFESHGYEVLSIDCTHDNTKFASSGGDRSVLLWDVASATVIRRYAGHLSKVNAVAFSEDSSVLASGSFDTSIRFWDIKSQQRAPLQVLDQARDSITSLVLRGPKLYAASVDGHVRAYDFRMGQIREDYFENPVVAVTLLTDGSAYLVSTLDSTHRLMDCKTGACLQSYRGHELTSYRSQSALDSKESHVLAGDDTGALHAWDLESGKQATAFPLTKAHERTILWTAHHPTADQAVTASADGTVKVWSGTIG